MDWLEIRHKIRIRKGGVVDGRPCYIFVGRREGSLVALMQSSHLHLRPLKCKRRMAICIKFLNLTMTKPIMDNTCSQ